MQQTVTQTYDIWNQWIRRQVDSGSPLIAETYFIYDAGQMVMSFNALRTSNMAQGRISSGTRYLWGPAVDQLLAEEGVRLQGSEGTLWQLTDNLGSVRNLAEYDEASGTTSVVNHITYDSFGNVTSETAAVDHLFGYTGRAYDEETDLQNNLNRWYDAASGKWLSEDPIGFAGGDANLYRYVGNSATNATDPSGLEEKRPKNDEGQTATIDIYIGHNFEVFEMLKKKIGSDGKLPANQYVSGLCCGFVIDDQKISVTQWIKKNYPNNSVPFAPKFKQILLFENAREALVISFKNAQDYAKNLIKTEKYSRVEIRLHFSDEIRTFFLTGKVRDERLKPSTPFQKKLAALGNQNITTGNLQNIFEEN